jgi:threonylcarbamoyladenosine tRNA methylthiotransferase MtaB
MKDISVSVINHGCKLNQFEGESLAYSCQLYGCNVVDFYRGHEPDIAIINTCTVTGKSDRKSRNSIYRAVSAKKKGGIVIVTGCYAETNRGDLIKIDGVDYIFRNGEKAAIPDTVRAFIEKKHLDKVSRRSPFDFHDPERPHRSRVYVKIQDGCNYKCSYCKVPLARGRSRSRDPKDILSYIKRIVENGYREIVLTGINLGDYRFGDMLLPGLLHELLEIDRTYRIRLSSIEPLYFSERMFEVLSNKRIAPHFHIPLQSGSNRILRIMKRPYDVERYLRVIQKIRKLRPESHFATDIIVGFPSEGEKDFCDTLEVVKHIGFASLHVFKFSPREGTGAMELDDCVHCRDKMYRSSKLISMGKELNYLYRKRFLGSVRETIFEEKHGDLEGITDNYIRVVLGSPQRLSGIKFERSKLPVCITEV